MLRIRPVFAALAVLALGTGTLVGATASRARTDDTTLCQYQVAQVSGGTYTVQNNEWGSAAPECVTTDGRADFQVANSSITEPDDGAPGGYPSIFAGCHWGDCTTGGLAAHPQLVASIGINRVRSSWYTTGPGGGGNVYDVSYDVWINRTPTTTGAPDGTELMIWIDHQGQVQPAGNVVADDVRIGGRHYKIWYNPGSGAGDGVSFEMIRSRSGVTALNIGALINYAVRHGYTNRSWYLIAVEAGFEIWQGGAGLTTRSFAVSLTRGARGWRAPHRKYGKSPQAVTAAAH